MRIMRISSDYVATIYKQLLRSPHLAANDHKLLLWISGYRDDQIGAKIKTKKSPWGFK